MSVQEAARRPFHESIVHAVMIEVREAARLPADFEPGLLSLHVLLNLLDRTKIPPAALPGVIKTIHDLSQQFQGKGLARLTGRLDDCVEFLQVYQAEMVEAGKLGSDSAWTNPAQVPS